MRGRAAVAGVIRVSNPFGGEPCRNVSLASWPASPSSRRHAAVPPPRRRRRRRAAHRAGGVAAAASAASLDRAVRGSVGRPRRRPDPSRVPRLRGPGHPRPEQGVDQHRHRRAPRPEPGPRLLRQGPQRRSRRWRRRCRPSRPTAQTYTFTLGTAKYSNGDPIVAGDFVYAWKRIIDPRTASTYQAFVRADVKGGAELLGADRQEAGRHGRRRSMPRSRKLGVAAPDDKTFVVTLAHPASYFLDIVGAVGRRADPEEVDRPARTSTEAANYVSSGPFMMKSWTHQAEIVLVPNPNWYGEQADPDRDRLQDRWRSGRRPGHLRGRRARHGPASPPDVPRVKADPTLGAAGLDTSRSLTYRLLGLQHREAARPPTCHFRLALSMAIDKDTMHDTPSTPVTAQSPAASSRPACPGHQARYRTQVRRRRSQDRARPGLTELGYERPRTSRRCRSGSTPTPATSFRRPSCRTSGGPTSASRARSSARPSTSSSSTAPPASSTIARDAWGAGLSASGQLAPRAVRSAGGNNDELLQSKPFDDLIAQAAAEPDQDKSIALYNQAAGAPGPGRPSVLHPLARQQLRSPAVRPRHHGTAQDSVVIGDYFYETISLAEH